MISAIAPDTTYAFLVVRYGRLGRVEGPLGRAEVVAHVVSILDDVRRRAAA